MSRPRTRLLWGSLGVAGVVGLAAGLAAVATDPGRPRAAGWRSAKSGAPGVAPAAATRPAVPLFSDDWYDDSGFSLTPAFSNPATDATSLTLLREDLEGRAERGIAQLSGVLQGLNPADPAQRVHVARLNMILGSLQMYRGEFAEAERRFGIALRADPNGSPQVRANFEAMLGVAALRRGETENCVACRNESSCLFPLAPEARHLKPSGSREAIRHFLAYLDARPDDVGVRWMLNVAAMTLGEYPDVVPPKHRIPLEPFQSKVDIGRFPNAAARAGLDVRGPNMAGGCVVDDFDGDGRLDVVFSTSDPGKGPSLFINRGDGTFDDRTESSGLSDQIACLNVKQADFDNDGRTDLLLLRGGWEQPRRPSLMKNVGGGSFVDVTAAAGVIAPISSQSGAWGDFDNDGWLDLYIPGEYDSARPDPRNRGRLYHSNCDGTFADVSDRAGVRNDRYGKGADWGDFDDDGDLDLYVSNLGQPNRLYENHGDGTFADVAPQLRVTEPIHSFACWFWDYDNDGRLDIYVNPYGARLSEIVNSHLGRPTTGERPRLFHNEGRGKPFRDVTREAGLDRVLIPMGSNFGDLDNDGFLDFYLGTGRPPYMYLVPNVMFRNDGGTRFDDVTTSTGTGHLQKGHGVAFADWDDDGDSDVFLEAGGATPGDRAGNILFENPGHGNHWVGLRLVGVRSNRSAIGARVTVDAAGPGGKIKSFHRAVTGGGSFGGNPLALTVGVGPSTRIAAVKVRWPGRLDEQVFPDIAVDRRFEITEGTADAKPLERRPVPRAE